MEEYQGWEHPLLAAVTKEKFSQIELQGHLDIGSDFSSAMMNNQISRVHLWRLERHERQLLARFPLPDNRPAWADPEQPKYAKLLVELLHYLHGRRKRRGQGAEQALAAVAGCLGDGADAPGYGDLMLRVTVRPTAYESLTAAIAALDALSAAGVEGAQAALRFRQRCGRGSADRGR